MIKKGLSYLKWAPMAIVLTVGIMASLRSSTATSGPPAIVDQPNLSSETRTVISFTDDLSAFDKRRAQLSRQSSVKREEFNSLEQTGNDLKRRVSQLRDATNSIINKLKAAGQWNTLDEEVLSRLTDSKDRSFLQDHGGLRRLFEQTAADLNSQSGDDIVAPLNQLRSKVARNDAFDRDAAMAWQIIPASYRPSSTEAPVFLRSLRCMGATIRLGVGMLVHGPAEGKPQNTIPKDTYAAFQCHCEDFNCPGAAVE